MANQVQLPEVFRFNPDWVKDEVPPWLLNILDKTVLKELALVSLERQKNMLDVQGKAIDRAVAILKQAKL